VFFRRKLAYGSFLVEFEQSRFISK